MANKIIVMGTLDTKASEGLYLKDRIESLDSEAILLDVSLQPHDIELGDGDITAEEVALAGDTTVEEIAEMDRTPAMQSMISGAKEMVKNLVESGEAEGIIAYGGGCGLGLAAPVFKELPTGTPKLLITTLPERAAEEMGLNDTCILSSITDLAGGKEVNSIEAITLASAAGAACGMVEVEPKVTSKKSSFGATQFGVTTTHIQKADEIIGEEYELLPFHATGKGGRTLEKLIRDGRIDGVLDVTTTELADELVGGVLSAGPERLEAAAEVGIPQVVLPGALDMVNFWTPDTVPEKFKGRNFYHHSTEVTLLRTTAEECGELGRIIARKVNKSKGPAAIIIPLRGWSQYDKFDGVKMVDYEGNETDLDWHNPEAIEKFVEAVEENIDEAKENIEVVKRDFHINDTECVELSIGKLKSMVEGGWEKTG